jgi:mRNA interferase RelE/StbE
VTYQVIVAPLALRALKEIRDRRERRKLQERIDQLASEPEKQGKALGDELTGMRSVRALGQRYRIVYKVLKDRVLVYVLWLGRRREGSRDDVYAVAKKLIRWQILS